MFTKIYTASTFMHGLMLYLQKIIAPLGSRINDFLFSLLMRSARDQCVICTFVFSKYQLLGDVTQCYLIYLLN